MKIFNKKKAVSALPLNFEYIKTEADKITDLNLRELFYTELFIRHKQEENRGNITQQINYEIELIHRTIELSNIKKTEIETPEKDDTDVASLKIRTVAILIMLNKLGLGTAYNDRTKVCKLIAFLTGNSYKTIYRELQKGVNFSKYHHKHIDEVNGMFEKLNSSISINIDKQY